MGSDDGINGDNSILAENPEGDMMIINVDLILRDGAYSSKIAKDGQVAEVMNESWPGCCSALLQMQDMTADEVRL